mgnify:CR=1 FL=1
MPILPINGSQLTLLLFVKIIYSSQSRPKPQLALSVWAITCAVDFFRAKHSKVATAIADLLTIAFFFLLQPGEYPMTSSRSKTGTVQFRRQEVRFFSNGNGLPHSATLSQIQQADGVCLYLDNQKNGQ